MNFLCSFNTCHRLLLTFIWYFFSLFSILNFYKPEFNLQINLQLVGFVCSYLYYKTGGLSDRDACFRAQMNLTTRYYKWNASDYNNYLSWQHWYSYHVGYYTHCEHHDSNVVPDFSCSHCFAQIFFHLLEQPRIKICCILTLHRLYKQY